MVSPNATFEASQHTYRQAYARHILIRAMYETAEELTGMSKDVLHGPLKWRVISHARWALWAGLYESVGLSYPQIGHLRKPKPWHHTSILHGVRKVNQDPQLRETANQIIQKARIMCGEQ